MPEEQSPCAIIIVREDAQPQEELEATAPRRSPMWPIDE